MVTEETVQVDAGQGGAGSGDGVFQTASSDGTRVFFTDSEELTPGAVANSLYVYDLLTGGLTDLGPVGFERAECPECSMARGDKVLGGNAAGSVVYVTSEAALTEAANAAGEKAIAGPGEGNIFMLHESGGVWGASFVATLSALDGVGYNPHPGESVPQHLAHLPVRVSSDGLWFAFMSNRSLTGYDSRDARSGVPDEEVFLYDASTRGLVCASCDPTGARPYGELDTGVYPGLPMDPTKRGDQRDRKTEKRKKVVVRGVIGLRV